MTFSEGDKNRCIIPIGMVSSPLDLTVRDRRLLVPNTSNRKPMKHKMMAKITNIRITLNMLTIAGVRQPIAAIEEQDIEVHTKLRGKTEKGDLLPTAEW